MSCRRKPPEVDGVCSEGPAGGGVHGDGLRTRAGASRETGRGSGYGHDPALRQKPEQQEAGARARAAVQSVTRAMMSPS